MGMECAAGSGFVSATRAIKTGQSDVLVWTPPIFKKWSSTDELTFIGAEFVAITPRGINSFLDRWYAERLRGVEEIAELLAHELIERDIGVDDADCRRIDRLFRLACRSHILC